MKRLAMLAATGLLTAIPGIASARPHFFFGFNFGFPVVVPYVAPAAVYVPPPVVAQAPVVTYQQTYVSAPAVCVAPPVVYAPAPACTYAYTYAPSYWYHRDYYAPVRFYDRHGHWR